MASESVIARRLREAQTRAGLSQKQLGIKAGIDEFSASPRINQYERGKHTPDYSTVERLAKVLKFEPAIEITATTVGSRGVRRLVFAF